MWTRFFCCLMFATCPLVCFQAPPVRRAATGREDSSAPAADVPPRGAAGVAHYPDPMPDPAATDPAATAVPAAPPLDRQRRMAVSTALYSIATGLSRIAGLVREMIAAFLFGIR